MDLNLLSGVDPDVDIQEVDPINQKRSLAFINHFILRTITFLNTFASTCESRFLDFEIKLRKIEASVCILESKLSSIPELNDNIDISNDQNGESSVEKLAPIENPTAISTEVDENISTISEPIEPNNNAVPLEDGICVKDDPRYSKYFKRLHFGVPEDAVRLSIKTDGFDPNILNDPNKIIPREKMANEESEHT